MKDRQPYPGKEGLMKHTPCDASGVPTGAPAYYAKVDMADSPLEIGTPFSKANILSDTTAAKYFASVTGDETPDQVLSKLGSAALKSGSSIKDALGNLITLPSAQLDSRVQISYGSYTGTGTYGSSNPNSITFPFVPKLAMILGYVQSGNFTSIAASGDPGNLWIIPTDILTTSYARYAGFGYLFSNINNYPYGKKSSDGKIIYWYSHVDGNYTTNAYNQLNGSDAMYYYVAIG